MDFKEIAAAIILISGIINEVVKRQERRKIRREQLAEKALLQQKEIERTEREAEIKAALERKEKEESERKRPKVDSSIVTDSKIYDFIWPLLTNYGCMRVYVTHFHDGTNSYAGQPLLKMSVLQEVRSHFTVQSVKPNHDNILISAMNHHIMKEIKDKGFLYVANNDDIIDSFSELHRWMGVYKVRSLLYIRIIDIKTEQTIAVLNIHWAGPHGAHAPTRDEILEQKKSLETIFDDLTPEPEENVPED